MTTSEPEVASALGQAIALRIGEPRYNLWFLHKTKIDCSGDAVVVGVPNHFYQDWLQKQFTDVVRLAAADVFGQPCPVRFVIDPELFQEARRDEVPRGTGGTPVKEPHPGGTPVPRPEKAKTRGRRWRHLHDFVVGPCNRVAHAAALSVVESPGQDANPLVLHGPVGTGKTHLLEGIYAGLRKRQPEWRVCFVTAEDFTNRFVQAMRLGKLSAFRRQFRECDALLLDDLHFLASKKATQEEFLHTFDALLADGIQVVVTCDCHPRLGEEFMPELADRLLGGAVWGLLPPDAATRLDLLRARMARGTPALGEDVLRYLAEQVRGNVRELEGALHSVQHYGRVAGKRVDVALAREALGDVLRHVVRVVQLADVDAAVCGVLRLEAGALQSKQRAWAWSHPRMLAMFLGRKHTAATYTEIGKHFGKRTHSTVVAAEKKVRQWVQDDGVLTLGERPLRVREILERVERELVR